MSHPAYDVDVTPTTVVAASTISVAVGNHSPRPKVTPRISANLWGFDFNVIRPHIAIPVQTFHQFPTTALRFNSDSIASTLCTFTSAANARLQDTLHRHWIVPGKRVERLQCVFRRHQTADSVFHVGPILEHLSQCRKHLA